MIGRDRGPHDVRVRREQGTATDRDKKHSPPTSKVIEDKITVFASTRIAARHRRLAATFMPACGKRTRAQAQGLNSNALVAGR